FYLSVSSHPPLLFCLMFRPPALSTLFPYTTLFRSTMTHITFTYDKALPFLNQSEIDNLGSFVQTAHDDLHNQTGAGSDYVNHHGDRKSTRLNSSHVSISYAVFCLKKKITINL